MTGSTDITTQAHQDIRAPYEDLLRGIFADGTAKSDRTGTNTRSVFGRQLRFDLSESFLLITTKKVHLKSIMYELLWSLRGDSDVRWLQGHGVTIWDEWADDDDDLDLVYDVQQRSWPTPDGHHIDQIAQVPETLRSNPDSRRNIVSAWNVSKISNMALPPCHLLLQFYIADDKLSCQLYQYSADMPLGVPFNVTSYVLLTHMMAQQAGLDVGGFIWTGGDCHIYDDRIEQCEPQISRRPRPYPMFKLRKADSIFDYAYENIEVVDYNPHPLIHGQVTV